MGAGRLLSTTMREIVHLQAGQCGNQIGAKFWKSFLMNMASIPPAPTLAPPTCSWKGSTCTTTKLLAESMCPGLSLSTWNLEPWTLSGVDLLDNGRDGIHRGRVQHERSGE